MTDEQLRKWVADGQVIVMEYGMEADPRDLADVAEELLACREVLRRVEWTREDEDGLACQVCFGTKPRQPTPCWTGHGPGCALKARIP